MNSGNFLNSLLGVSGTNTAASKDTSAKTRTDTSAQIRMDSTEKFRNALEQARPEVAVSKPAARKTPPHAEQSQTRQARENTAASSRAATEPRGSSTVEKPGTTKREPVKTAEGKSVDQTEKTNSTDVKGQAESDQVEATPVIATTNEMVKTGEVSTNTNVLALLSGVNAELVPDAESNPVELAEEVDPALLFGLTAPLADEQPAQEESLELVDGALVASATKGPLASGNSVSDDIRPFASVLPSTLLAGNQSSHGLSLVAPDPANDAPQQTFDPDLTANPSMADNPDFLTLNGKAAFGKLMNDHAANDKALDPAKPLQTPLITEPLTRLTEAQSPAARSFIVQTGVPVTVGQPQWSQAVGEKVLWLAAQNVSAAEIRLDPPDMGQLHVKVSVNQDQASVTFTSPHPMVREALDQQLNRLREMFSEQGLNLVNVDVSDRSAAQQEQDKEQGSHAGASSGDVEDDELNTVAMTSITSSRLVDHYA